MRRDLDLIRKIILAIEDQPEAALIKQVEIDGYSAEQIGYHSYLIIESGLAKGEDITLMHGLSPDWLISHLTSAGHDFADSARSENTWVKAKKILLEKGGGLTLELVKETLIGVIKGALAAV